MAIYFYNPPEKTEDGEDFPPFIIELNGDCRVVMAHKYWKRVDEKYVIELLFDKHGKPKLDPKTGKQLAQKGIKSSWVLDKELNDKLAKGEIKPPDNMIDLSNNELLLLAAAKYAPFMKYMVSQASQMRKQKQSFEQMRKAQMEEIEQERQEIERTKQQMKAQRDQMEKELAAQQAELAELKKRPKAARE